MVVDINDTNGVWYELNVTWCLMWDEGYVVFWCEMNNTNGLWDEWYVVFDMRWMIRYEWCLILRWMFYSDLRWRWCEWRHLVSIGGMQNRLYWGEKFQVEQTSHMTRLWFSYDNNAELAADHLLSNRWSSEDGDDKVDDKKGGGRGGRSEGKSLFWLHVHQCRVQESHYLI